MVPPHMQPVQAALLLAKTHNMDACLAQYGMRSMWPGCNVATVDAALSIPLWSFFTANCYWLCFVCRLLLLAKQLAAVPFKCFA